MSEAIYPQGFTQNRELSWLQFNARMLLEAQDKAVPLLERLKFLAIFTSNLDEFYMVRVGSLTTMAALAPKDIDNKSGMTASQQLGRIYETTPPLYRKRDKIYAELKDELNKAGLTHVTPQELTGEEKKFLDRYFATGVQPILSPQIVDSQHPFPHLMNKVLHVGVLLGKKKGEMLGLIPVPASLPTVIRLSDSKARYILLPDLLLLYADRVFNMYDVLEKTLLCVTRNADIQLDDEPFDPVGGEVDVRVKMEQLLRKRVRLNVVRLELTESISTRFAELLRERFEITPQQVYVSRKCPLDLSYTYGLGDLLPEPLRASLNVPPFSPQQPAMLPAGQSLLKAAMKKDIFLSYPYESMEPFLQMVREAANDPAVVSIRMTIYRLAKNAKLVDYLCAAAENGKDVTVLIELRARFDEANNIDWSERFEEAGVKVIYGFEGFKVHSKICLITRNERGTVRHITQVGTGNYNEKTAKLYTDVSLVTASESIGADAAEFFQNMALGNLEGEYKRLLVAPGSLRSGILSLIDEQIALGRDGYILLKFNSLTDVEILRKLHEASLAGVKVEMIIRGICCLLPGIPGKTENISVISIVGRYLEHSRIYIFGKGENEKMYISSADLMTRNTVRRVEIACPIDSPEIRARLHEITDCMLQDTIKARVLLSDGTYVKKAQALDPICAQEHLMKCAMEAAKNQPAAESPKRGTFWRRVKLPFCKGTRKKR